ncbi:hypothetical protein [Mucilaginibacter segetis]|uniref:Uncharacterized protein n=1 Tax=Mucilaginibacter segetis TaxID=2793071 RepID=A0A934UM22_9SPHI|nr:hypothetical protein [Mucilaginibacter segetis]MBK0379193.1 hypothetical protein [Mucilaginibacter segetis]
MKRIFIAITFLFISGYLFAQHSDEGANLRQLNSYKDSLITLGKRFINNPDELERKNANYTFIRTLVSALKIPHSFNYSFDSVKSISVLNSPDNRFRIFSWHIMNRDGSYRFYGTIQMNTGDRLLMYPLEDYSPFIKQPADTITDNHKWYGAQYYKIARINASRPYYVLLGWKGNNIKSTKRVIETLSFGRDDKPIFGMPVFNDKNQTHNRIVFEYTRQASMLLRYVPEQQLIVFDHLAPPDKKLKDKQDTYGPDLSYDGYQLKNGKWILVDDLDMRNVPNESDEQYVDPKIQAIKDKNSVPLKQKN